MTGFVESMRASFAKAMRRGPVGQWAYDNVPGLFDRLTVFEQSIDKLQNELEQMRKSKLSLHKYVSTYCQHAVHEECRGECKLCAAPCLCECHRGG